MRQPNCRVARWRIHDVRPSLESSPSLLAHASRLPQNVAASPSIEALEPLSGTSIEFPQIEVHPDGPGNEGPVKGAIGAVLVSQAKDRRVQLRYVIAGRGSRAKVMQSQLRGCLQSSRVLEKFFR